MLDKIRDLYLKEGIMQYFMNAGSGVPGVHDVITDSAAYVSADYAVEKGEYVYAIEMYTDGVTFDDLDEDGATVEARRLNAGGNGYPLGSIITGKFSKIVPATDCVCGIFIKKRY